MTEATKKYIKRFEQKISEPTPPNILRYIIPNEEVIDAELAAKVLAEWNVILKYRITNKNNHHEFYLYTR